MFENLIRLMREDGASEASGGGGGFNLDLSAAMSKEPEATPAQTETNSSEPSTEPKSEAPKVDDDPEYELDYEEEPGKKAKTKLSELKATAKWLNDNKQLITGSLKIRDEASKNPAFGKALQTLISQAYDEKGNYNGQAVDSILSKLEAKAEAVQEKIDDKTDDIADMEKMLSDLDEDSPHASILKKNIAAAKSLRAQMSQSLEMNKKLQERLDGLDKFKTELTTKEETKLKDSEVKRLSDTYQKEIGALCDPAKSDGYRFVDTDEQADFDRAVRDSVAQKAEGIKSDAEFVKVVKEAAKAVYDKMSKRREAYVNDYLKKKSGAPKEPEQKTESKKPLTFEDMGAALGEAALTA